MGSWVYGWIADNWGVNVAGILLIIFVGFYFYFESIDAYIGLKKISIKGSMSPRSNMEAIATTSLPEITTTLSYLESSERQ